ncbi:MAG: rhodanese-like domain-containing protein [Alphaproteobacteria bacterium]|nr:rhodanese-like domain-containing protein [Alphaproteobacteria bacterium]
MLLGAGACVPTAESTAAESTSAREIDVKTLKSDLDAKKVPVLVDVRTPEEFAEGHVPSAKNIPLDQLGKRLDELEPYREQEVYLVCRSGARSARAASLLGQNGIPTVNVAGGTLAWQAAGLATE